MRRLTALALDVAIVALTLPVALLLRENLIFDADKFWNHLPFLVATLLMFVALMRLLGLDRTHWHYSTSTDHLQLALVVLMAILAATLMTFTYNRLEGISRSVPILQVVLATAALVGARAARRTWLGMRFAAGRTAPTPPLRSQNVLLIGLNPLAEFYATAIAEHGEGQVSIAGIVDYSDEFSGMRIRQLHVFGGGKGIQDAVDQLGVHGVIVDRLVLTIPATRLPEEARHDLQRYSERARMPVEFFADQIDITNWAKPAPTPDAEVQAEVSVPAADGFMFSPAELARIKAQPYWRAKRAIDVVLSFVLIATLWPLALIVALLAAIDVGFPVLFWQVRPGIDGHPFKLFKFCTMLPAHDDEGRRRNDQQRLSAIGRFLRKTRLDELPQLWNILRGEMSFIGPRPLLPIDQAPAFAAARQLIRPGLTGWAQIMGGRDIPPADKAVLDIWYLKNASLKLDLAIVKGTFPMVLKGERVDQAAIEEAWNELDEYRAHAAKLETDASHETGRATA